MMKKFGKIFLIVAVVVIAMLAMMTVASAAEISSVSASVAADEGRTISVTVNYGSPEAAQQSTILVVPTGTDIATLKDSAIKYIDQETVSEGTVTYTFKLLETDRQGTYDVYVGGTAVDAPKNTSVSFDTRKIIGKISVLGKAEKATAVATPTTEGAAPINGKVASDGNYTIEVSQGTYNVVLGKQGYLYKTFNNVTVGADGAKLEDVTLLAGDVSGDSKITLTDLNNVLEVFNANSATLDVDDDGKVTLTELQNVLANFNKAAN